MKRKISSRESKTRKKHKEENLSTVLLAEEKKFPTYWTSFAPELRTNLLLKANDPDYWVEKTIQFLTNLCPVPKTDTSEQSGKRLMEVRKALKECVNGTLKSFIRAHSQVVKTMSAKEKHNLVFAAIINAWYQFGMDEVCRFGMHELLRFLQICFDCEASKVKEYQIMLFQHVCPSLEIMQKFSFPT